MHPLKRIGIAVTFVDDHPFERGVVLDRIERDARKVRGFLCPDIGAAPLQEEVESTKDCREHYKVSRDSVDELLSANVLDSEPRRLLTTTWKRDTLLVEEKL